ncbi:MAG: L-rhamnose mutarotase [Paludibacter sp.]|nr:L-rhamnose mutarotase [Paludibacter sp.]
MKRVAFKMYLKRGFEAEYTKRHKEIWPELKKLLQDAGVSDYSIFWDKETNVLFAVQKNSGVGSQNLSETEIVKRWWKFMSDIMETNPDNSPISIELDELFYME